MKKIAIYCINYNSYNELHSFLMSVDRATSLTTGSASLDVFIADNTKTEYRKDIELNGLNNVSIKIFNYNDNPGYFGAAQRMMHATDATSYDYAIISNVDLTLKDDALQALIQTENDKNVGWIAPSLFSAKLNRDRNPELMHRYSVRKLKLIRLMFKYPPLQIIYKNTLYKRKKLKAKINKTVDIYAGHGSLIILTKQYLNVCGIPDYPIFLFCEELYLAEKCRLNNLRVIYRPDIHILDEEHVSIGKIHRSASYYKYNYDAVSYIINNFY